MINKILEEMTELRLNKDYKNYRTLNDALSGFLYNEYLRLRTKEITNEIMLEIKNIKSIIETEIQELDKILSNELDSKEYGNFKVVSQVYNALKDMYKKLDYLHIPTEFYID